MSLNQESGEANMKKMAQNEDAKSNDESISNRENDAPDLSSNPSICSGLFQHMNDGFAYCKVISDPYGNPVDYVFSDVNIAFRSLIKLKDQQVLGRKATEVIPSINNESVDWIVTCGRVAQTGKSVTFERHCPTFDKWFAVNAYCPEKGYFAMIIKDVTQRKKTERALRQSEKQYKKLANSITDPFFALDSCLKFNYWNKESEKFTGITAGNAVGKHFFEVFEKDKATRKAARIYLKVMKTHRPQTFIDKLPKCNGKKIFEIQVYPTGNGISVLAKDITERKKLQVAMEQYTKRLEEIVKIRTEKLKDVERLAAIGETAGMIGHDIRNPLQSIIGELYLAKDELNYLSESEAKKNLMASLTSIEEQTVYINKIVTDLQDYAKPLAPAIQETDLEEIIQAVFSALDIPDNVTVSYLVEKPFPTFKTDPSFMKRILTNLIRNGVQAMQEKGGELTINTFPRQKTVIMAISDSGTGIPDEAKDKIFKPLFTTKSKGQGFGLAVVKKLVEALGGNISFETKLEKGTTFIIEMPLRE
jgi:PAS domain S-box-containing protein